MDKQQLKEREARVQSLFAMSIWMRNVQNYVLR
jgi:hypothetical protein